MWKYTKTLLIIGLCAFAAIQHYAILNISEGLYNTNLIILKSEIETTKTQYTINKYIKTNNLMHEEHVRSNELTKDQINQIWGKIDDEKTTSKK